MTKVKATKPSKIVKEVLTSKIKKSKAITTKKVLKKVPKVVEETLVKVKKTKAEPHVIKMKKLKPMKPSKIVTEVIASKTRKPKAKATENEIKKVKKEPRVVEENVIKVKKTKRNKGNVLPSQYITEELVESCLDALDKMAAHYKKKNKMFEEESPIFVEINCMKIQNVKGKATFLLPHSTVASTGEVCLITPDLKKGRKPDHEPTVDHWEEMLRKNGINFIKTVLPMRQLRVEYDQFELKRRLMTQHDFILVDTRIMNHVTYLLGKKFFRKPNMLVPVRVNEKNLKKSLENGLKTAILHLADGVTSTIQIAHLRMRREQVKENILAVVGLLKEKYPGGEANVRSLSVKLPLSLSLPLYVTLRSSNKLHQPTLHRSKPTLNRDVEGELSTIIGASVKVTADGVVHVNRANGAEESDAEKVDASDEENDEAGEKMDDSD